MPRWQFAPFFFATAALAAWHEVLVAIDGVTLAFDPPSITAVANDAIHFVVPNSKMMLVQAKSLAEPCTPLPGGFRSVLGLGKLDVTINDTTPFYVYADLFCTRGMVFITNAANAGDYDTLLANALALADQPGRDAEPESPAPQSETTPAPSQSSSESSGGTGTRSESSHGHETPSSAGPPADSSIPSNSETAVTPPESSGPSTGLIAAVAVICVLATALVAAIVFICVRRRRRSRVPAKNDDQWSIEWPRPEFRPQPYIATSSVQTLPGTVTSVQGSSSTRPQRSEKTTLRLAAAARPGTYGEFDSPQPSPSLFVQDSVAGSSSAPSSSSGDSDATRKLEMVQELLERGVSNRAVLTALRTVNGEVVDDPSPVSAAAPRMSVLKGPPPTYVP